MATVRNRKNNQPSAFFRIIDPEFKKTTHAKYMGGNANASALDEYKRRAVTAIQQKVADGSIKPLDLGVPSDVSGQDAKEAFNKLRSTDNPWGWDKAAFFKGSNEEEAELRAAGVIDGDNHGLATEQIEGSSKWELALTPAQKDIVNLIIWTKLNAPAHIRSRVTGQGTGEWVNTVEYWFRGMPDSYKEELFYHIRDVVTGRAEDQRTKDNLAKHGARTANIEKQGEGGAQINLDTDENTGASSVKAQRLRAALIARGERPSISDVTRQLIGDKMAADSPKVAAAMQDFAEDWGLDISAVNGAYVAIVSSVAAEEEERVARLRRRQGKKTPGSLKQIFRTPYEVLGLVWMQLVLPRFNNLAGRLAARTARNAKVYFGGANKLPRTMIDGIRRTLDLDSPAKRGGKPPAIDVPTDWAKFVAAFIDAASSNHFDELATLDKELAKRKEEMLAASAATGVPAFIDADFVEALGMAWYAFVLSDIRIKIASVIDYLSDAMAKEMLAENLPQEEIEDTIASMARDIVDRAVDEVLKAYSLQSVSKRRIVDSYIKAIEYDYPSFPEEEAEKLGKRARSEEDAEEQIVAQTKIDDAESRYIERELNKAFDPVRRSIIMRMYNEIPANAYDAIIKNNPAAARAILGDTERAAGEYADRSADIATLPEEA